MSKTYLGRILESFTKDIGPQEEGEAHSPHSSRQLLDLREFMRHVHREEVLETLRQQLEERAKLDLEDVTSGS